MKRAICYKSRHGMIPTAPTANLSQGETTQFCSVQSSPGLLPTGRKSQVAAPDKPVLFKIFQHPELRASG